MKRLITMLFVILVITTGDRAAAEEYPDWKGFPPMYDVQDMVEFNGEIYCACKGGLVRYNPETQEYTLYYKNHGLLSNNVTCITATSNCLYLGFENAGLVRLDPVTERYEQILFPEYVTNRETIALKRIFAQNDSVLYIGHSRGVDKINVFTKELRTFSKLGKGISEGETVNDVKVIKGKIFACTALGLAVADADNPDLEIAGNWKNYFYGGSRFNCVERIIDEYDDIIYIGTSTDGIVYFDEQKDRILPTGVTSGNIYHFAVAFGIAWAASDWGLYKKIVRMWALFDNAYLGLISLANGSDGNLWVGTLHAGLKCYTSGGYNSIPAVGGPRNSAFYNFDLTDDNVLWITTSYKGENYDALLLRYDGVTWTEYREDEGVQHTIVDVVVDTNKYKWLASWGKGLYIMTDDGYPEKKTLRVERVDPAGDFIKWTIGKNFFVCSDLMKDKYGNIWVANHQAQEKTSGAVVLDGYPITKYQTYSPEQDGLISAEIMKLDVDNDNWVWLGTFQEGLIGVYVGEDPYDKSDTYVENFDLEDGLLGMNITAVNHDRDGDVWVGTKAGLNRIKKLPNKKFKVDDMTMLLEGEVVEVTCIEVDKMNNKWIGTSLGGLYKLDAKNEFSGRYTTQNSGLFSDTILSLKYDNVNNILWVGTDTGLNEFFVYGSTPERKNTDIHIYPNPFEIWGTNSLATFANLKQLSHIKIYTFTGELVNELVADKIGNAGGASAFWNGRNFRDEAVGSGLYFYTGTDADGRQFRDKMVVIRR